MNKFAALPVIAAMGLSLTACGKHRAVDNSPDANGVPSDETITDNDAAAADFVTDNTLDADNAADAGAAPDVNAADANAF